jgi:PAS domain S-box-containing protein
MPREIALLQAIAERAWHCLEHVRMVQALRESEALARLLVDGAKDQAIVMLDPAGKLASWNKGAERLCGYASAEVLGKPATVFQDAEDGAELLLRETLAQAEASGRSEHEGWRVRKDGTRFWAQVATSSLRDETGVLGGFVYVMRDVSLRKQAEQDERWKAAVLGSAFDAIVSMDHRGLIREWNPAAERLLGHARSEVLGSPVSEVMIPPPYRAAHERALRRYLASGVPTILGSRREFEALHADGSTRSVELSLVRLEGQTPPIFTAFVRDISVRKKLEAERERLVTELRELNADLEARVASRTAELQATLSERGLLLQEIHHRVKNNLQIIWSLINMQLRQVTDTPTRLALVDCQTRVSAIALVHQQLYRSRDFANVPFAAYAASLARAILAANDVSRGRVELALAIEDIAFTIDRAIPSGLILTELITNALKYAFPGGRRGTIRIGLARRDRGEIVLSVGDDGVGLPRDFDPARATSLGLQLVEALTEQLGGRLEIERTGGTTIAVAFPEAKPTTPPAPAP